ncbi:MAG TPA: sigma-70 family RNA polymerase sigma factor [Gemmatimonadales bacterium]|nr:sigma-70 family RNA polymerase sigma factor [Gemmatimonadales bacterium]
MHGFGLTPDRELAQAVLQDGDERAFRELYRRHTPKLYLLVLRLLGYSEMDAEDVVQETWVRAMKELAGFRWESALGTWLSAIGCNVARDQLRKLKRREEREQSPALASWIATQPPERVDLEQAIRRLPEGYRTVLVMHDLEGFTHEEIGTALGIAPGTSKSQLFGARRSLRAMLNPVVEAEDVARG